MKEHTISEMSLAEYLFAFKEERNALSDTYIRQASESGRLFCLTDNDTYLGYICTVIGSGIEQIVYSHTKKAYRGRGVFTSLAEHIVSTANTSVKAAIHEKNQCFDVIKNVCLKLGFEETECIHVYDFDRESKAEWARFKERVRYNECRAFLERSGYETVSLDLADEGLIKQIEGSRETPFGNPFCPADYFRYPSKRLAREFSFAAVRNGELAAYLLVSQPSEDALLAEHMVTSLETRGSGVIMLPLVCTVDRFFESGLRRFSFSIYPSNISSNSIRKNMQKDMTITDTVTYNFLRQSAAKTAKNGHTTELN